MILQSMMGIAAVLIGAFLSYAYHFFMVRSLSPSLYGDLSLIIGILTIVLVPTGSLQTVLTRDVARLGRDDKILGFLRGYMRNIVLFSLAGTVLFFLSSFLIGYLFSDQNIILPLQLVSLSIPVSYILSLIKAYYQGREKIFVLSALLVAEPVVKLMSAFLLVYAGFGLLGATASIAVAPFIIIFLFAALLWKMYRTEKTKQKINSNRTLAFVLLTNVFLMVFLYLDLFFVKYYLGSEGAGFYNVANITAKVLMFAVGGITLVLLPKSSKLNMGANSHEIKKLVTKAVLLMLPIFIVFLLFPEQIISIFYTSGYLSALAPFRILTVGMFAYAIFLILLNLSWSQNREKVPLVLSVAFLIADAIMLFFLIPAFGLAGAALSTTISSIALLLLLAAYLKNGFKAAK